MFEDEIRPWWNLVRRPPHWVMSGAEKVVTVRVDAKAFDNLKTMQKITAQTLGRLGCDGCHSGYDIRFLLERDFRATPAGEVAPIEVGPGF
jgi:hypothetical protein